MDLLNTIALIIGWFILGPMLFSLFLSAIAAVIALVAERVLGRPVLK